MNRVKMQSKDLAVNIEKEKFRAFYKRHYSRLCCKYPFLSKGQIKMKISQRWDSFHRKHGKSVTTAQERTTKTVSKTEDRNVSSVVQESLSTDSEEGPEPAEVEQQQISPDSGRYI